MSCLLLRRDGAAQADAEGVRAAIERANSPAVWGEALRRGDPAPLGTAWAGDPLVYFSGEVRAYRARGIRLLSSLVELEFLGVRLLSNGQALAETRERWFDRLCTAAGELRAERQAVVHDHYALNWLDGAWWVVGVDIALLEGSLDWTPATDQLDGPSPCAAVVDSALVR